MASWKKGFCWLGPVVFALVLCLAPPVFSANENQQAAQEKTVEGIFAVTKRGVLMVLTKLGMEVLIAEFIGEVVPGEARDLTQQEAELLAFQVAAITAWEADQNCQRAIETAAEFEDDEDMKKQADFICAQAAVLNAREAQAAALQVVQFNPDPDVVSFYQDVLNRERERELEFIDRVEQLILAGAVPVDMATLRLYGLSTYEAYSALMGMLTRTANDVTRVSGLWGVTSDTFRQFTPFKPETFFILEQPASPRQTQ